MNSNDKSKKLYDIIRMIRPVHRRLARVVEARLDGTRMTVGMRAVLEVLDETGPLSVPDVARVLFIARQQVQLMINALEDQALIERRPNPAHKRSALFVLTARGQLQFAEIRMRENEDLSALTLRFSDEDLQAAQKVFQAMFDHFAGFEDDPNQPRPLE